ncbi:MAG: hypothetical protein DLM61_03385 [Pseudonocardiales bacterium]|nr:MAG: hypothetical protein DLM61_03385 [Pseudonocardiales bacterium]
MARLTCGGSQAIPLYEQTFSDCQWLLGEEHPLSQVVAAILQATTRRVSCPEHGVVVAGVPWARPGSRFTTAFEDTCAWLVCHAALSVVAVLLRVAWRSVSDIVGRVVAERAGQTDRLAGLRRIGIDEISYRKGQRYLLVVTCHDTGRLVWAGKDRNQDTLGRFFDDLGAQRAAALTHVSADGSTTSSPPEPHRRCCAWTPSTWWPGPPKPWTPYAGRWPPSYAPAGSTTRPPRSRAAAGRC